MQKKKTSSLHHRINHKPKHLFSKKKNRKKIDSLLALSFFQYENEQLNGF